MAYSLNKVQLIGNLGRDPETRYTQDGRPITTLNIATSETWRDAQGEQQERTEWHRVVLFGKPAEIAQQYLQKGGKIYIEGKLQTRKWTDQQGQDRYTTEIVISGPGSSFILLDGRSSGGGAPSAQGGQRPAAYSGGQPPQSGQSGHPGQPAATARAPENMPYDDLAHAPDFTDDIPF